MEQNYLIKSEGVIFKNLLTKGYTVQENLYKVISEKEMVDGSSARNYGVNKGVEITLTFGRLDKEGMKKYFEIFRKPEATFTYYSPMDDTYKTNTFYIEVDEIEMLNSLANKKYEEFSVKLKKSGV